MNDHQKASFVSKMVEAMFNTIAGKRIAVSGAAFKAHTSDTRDSPALDVCRALMEERAEVVLCDPQALENARIDLGDLTDKIHFEPDPIAAAKGAHAIALLTDWPEYANLDYEAIHARMVKPSFVFDGRIALPHEKLHEIGFNVFPIGKPSQSHLVG
jgi:UDPglucose 6-dehydrogenase